MVRPLRQPLCLPLYLLRHGQSEWNVQRLTQGQADAPGLTDVGRAQALRAAELIRADLAGEAAEVGAIRTSDLARAAETAALVAGVLGGAPVADPRLREQHLGALEGRPYEETWAAAADHDWSDPDLAIAGGESPSALRERVAAALAAADRSVVTVLVTHGDTIRAAVALLSRTPPHEAPWVEVPNGAVARVDAAGLTWLGAGVS